MKYILVTLLLAFVINIAQAEAIAQAQNEGGGFIVLTNQVCKSEGKTFKELRRAYSYTSNGNTQDGCYAIEDETVVVVWETGNKKRYHITSFSLINRGKAI